MDMELQHTKLGGFRRFMTISFVRRKHWRASCRTLCPISAGSWRPPARCFSRQRETVDGSVRVTGTARTAVLYLPEEGETPCCLTLNIPFLCSGDHPAIQSGCLAHVSARVISADAQVLNPRKILARWSWRWG